MFYFVIPMRLELIVLALKVRCVNQLRYGIIILRNCNTAKVYKIFRISKYLAKFLYL